MVIAAVAGDDLTTPQEGSARQTLFETSATVKLILQSMREMREDGNRQKDETDRELRTIKHDARNGEQIISGRMEMGDRRMGEIERRIGQVETTGSNIERRLGHVETGIAKLVLLETTITKLTDSLEKMADDFEKVKQPLSDLVDFRNRIMWGGTIVAAVAMFLWIFVSPVYKQLIERFLPGSPPAP